MQAAVRYLIPVVLFVTSAASAVADMAGVENPQRARVNYMLNCQGCHGPAGTGTTDGTVPRLEGHLARFLHVEGGREFLVRVPGSANAALSDPALAEVINWMVGTYDSAHLPPGFKPYDAAEVARLRANPLTDVIVERARLVKLLKARGLAAQGQDQDKTR